MPLGHEVISCCLPSVYVPTRRQNEPFLPKCFVPNRLVSAPLSPRRERACEKLLSFTCSSNLDPLGERDACNSENVTVRPTHYICSLGIISLPLSIPSAVTALLLALYRFIRVEPVVYRHAFQLIIPVRWTLVGYIIILKLSFIKLIFIKKHSSTNDFETNHNEFIKINDK